MTRLACALVVLCIFAAPVLAQQRARPVDTLTEEQRADYRRLIRSYLETFRILGWSTRCAMKFDAAPHFQELAYRHGEKGEPMEIARMAYKAGAEHVLLDHAMDPKPPAPIPCDVMVYLKGMGLPPLPASLVQP